MEFFTIFLSGLLSVASPAGLVLDTVVESEFREQFETVEELEIRIDNVPSYQIIQGEVQRIRLASRGVYLTSDFRIDTLEMETDGIDLDLSTLQSQRGREGLQQALNQPLQGGFRVVITEADLNQLLQSPEIQSRLPELINKARGNEDDEPPGYTLLEPQIDFLDNNRVQLQVQFQRTKGKKREPLDIVLELGFQSPDGRTLQIIDPQGTINGRDLSQRLLDGFAEGISDRLDLSKLEEKGLLTRLLQFQIDAEQLQIAGFARFEDEESTATPAP